MNEAILGGSPTISVTLHLMTFVCYCPDSTSGQVAISADPATVAGLNIPGKEEVRYRHVDFLVAGLNIPGKGKIVTC